MKILSAARNLVPIKCGYECDVYQIADRRVYKHYAPWKIARRDYPERENPTRFLVKLRNPFCEPVLDFDDEGFVTYQHDQTIGSFAIITRQHPKFLDHLRSILVCLLYLRKDGITHNDINPTNMMYNAELDQIFLIDWTQQGLKPIYSQFADDVSIASMQRLIANTGDQKWYSPFTPTLSLGHLHSIAMYNAVMKNDFSNESVMRSLQQSAKELQSLYQVSWTWQVEHVCREIETLQKPEWEESINKFNEIIQKSRE